jgi:hypothetical protein
MRGEVDVELLYFPLSLMQLSAFDPFAIEGGEETFRQVSRIPTDYTIRRDHDALLADSVRSILDADQGRGGSVPEAGWAVGPRGERLPRLGDAFVQVLLQAQGSYRTMRRSVSP